MRRATDIDAKGLQVVDHLVCTEVFLRTATHEHILHLLVEAVSIGKH